MKISLSWLQDYIYLPETAEQISGLLTGCGLEVENIEKTQRIPGGLEGLVVGQVLTCTQHPNAERLSLTTVDVGAAEPLHIVCGAPNVAAGQKVIIALIGATLYPKEGDPFKIKKSKIRGELSEGMICAEDEIGLGESHAGIMVLDTPLPNGTPASKYFNLQDEIVFEIGLTPNRADAASHYGTARDLKALLNRQAKLPDVASVIGNSSGKGVGITIEDAAGCPRYAGVSISGVTVGASPEWLQERLRSIGVGPVNNVVDVTNYVLHSIGHPLHAFDRSKIKGDQIIVKYMPEGTAFTTLDKTERKLKAHNLMICDAEEPLAIAGVFGGLDSGISAATSEIFIESAYFNPVTVRKSSQSLGIKTDSSFRFERGADPDMPVIALKLAAKLITEIAGGEISSAFNDVYPEPITPAVIKADYNKLTRLIGKDLSQETINQILGSLDIQVVPEETFGHDGFAETFTATVPPFRVDVTRPADLAEEVMRIYGFNNIDINETLGSAFLAEFPETDTEAIRNKIGDMLSAKGFSEIINNSLTNANFAGLSQTLNPEQNVLILNRLSEDLGAMRQTLLFGALQTMLHNINRKRDTLNLFEFGKTYRKADGKYSESNRLALFITGSKQAENWQRKPEKTDYFVLAEAVQVLLQKLGFTNFSAEKADNDLFEYAQNLVMNKRAIVTIGLVSQRITKAFEIKQPVFFADIDWDYLMKKYNPSLKYSEISRFPEVRRDLSLVLDKKVSFAEIEKLARQTEKKLLRDLNVFDVFEGPQIGADKKSYSVSFILQDNSQTLTDTITGSIMQRLQDAFERELGAVVRK
ncbi:MAG: phenylalanine--tRNA ligase subunit beta [Bacteroidota bacterium]